MADLVERALQRGFDGLGFFACRQCAAFWQQYTGFARKCPECQAVAIDELEAAQAAAIIGELTRMAATFIRETGIDDAVANAPEMPAGMVRAIAEATLAADEALNPPEPSPDRRALRVVPNA